jgi:biopolymer transport protein ExbD
MKKKKKKVTKLNLIPILDAIFIFIFFLLMSAQFIDIYQIGTDAPAVKKITEEEKNKKDPLNLKLKITTNRVSVTKGMVPSSVGQFNLDPDGLNAMQAKLSELKKAYPDENTAIIGAERSTHYKEIIQVIDRVTNHKINGKDTPLFKLIVFDQR